MGLKTFHVRDLHHGLSHLVQSLLRVEDEAGFFHEAVRGQGREEPGRAARGQHMVRTGDVIAHGLGRVVAEEYGAGVLDQCEQLKGFLDGKLQMLGRDGVRDISGILQRFHEHDRTKPVDGLAGDLFPAQVRELALDLGADFFRQFAGGGDEDRGRKLVVLRLRQQVRGHERRIRRARPR